MITTVLVDDEPLALKHLANLLEKNCPELSIVGQSASVTQAVEAIKRQAPDLVFLDIELAGEKSFDVFEKLKSADFEIIFVTAYSQFGIQALKHGATDYVLKPINKKELFDAVEKVVKKIQKRKSQLTGVTQENLTNSSGRLALPTLEGLLFVDVANIIYCESEGRYTRFHLADESKEILVSKNLGEYEAQLPSSTFIRIHHQSIVNIHYVHKYVKGRGGYVVLKNGKNITVSSRKKDEFFDKLS